jgi:glycosyltransferase involved in cell wall biosynthesis
MGLGDKVHFAGHVDDFTLRALYKVSNVAVFPSRFEPFGIVALEAMASHCPVVATAVGGLNEIVDHEGTGLKVPPNDVGALAWAIERLIRDEGFRSWVVENAYRKCLWDYNWDRISEWTSGTYNRVSCEYGTGSWKP